MMGVKRSHLLVLSCIILPVACDDSTSPTGPVGDAGATVAPFYSGVFLGDDATTPERVRAELDAFTDIAGHRPSLVKSFHAVDADFSGSGWAGRLVHEVAATGATNYVALDLTWQGRPSGSLLDQVAAGTADDMLRRVARGLAAVDGVVLVEPAWEMNGDWAYAWQGAANGQDETAPARYVRAWRHVVDLFRSAGATNVRWVFAPNTGNALTGGSPGPSHWNWWGHYYPGDAFVDYMGTHGFNGARAFGTPYHSFADLFFGRDADRVIEDMARLHPDKPILIGEMATEEGSDKAGWIRDAYAHMRDDSRIIGAVWFHMDKEADWRVNSDAAALSAYRDALQAPHVLATFQVTPTLRVASR